MKGRREQKEGIVPPSAKTGLRLQAFREEIEAKTWPGMFK